MAFDQLALRVTYAMARPFPGPTSGANHIVTARAELNDQGQRKDLGVTRRVKVWPCRTRGRWHFGCGESAVDAPSRRSRDSVALPIQSRIVIYALGMKFIASCQSLQRLGQVRMGRRETVRVASKLIRQLALLLSTLVHGS